MFLFLTSLFLFFIKSLSVFVLHDYDFTNIIYAYDPTIDWSSSPSYSYSTKCPSSTLSIVGGYQRFYQSQYINAYYASLPAHSAIKVTFSLYLLDKWTGQTVEVLFDKVSVSNASYTSNGSSNICGNTYTDMIQNITLQQTHSSSTFEIKIQSHINLPYDYGYTLSWGVRDYLLYLDVPCPYLCSICSGNVCSKLVLFAQQDPITLDITCKDGFFIDIDNNLCNICHYSCQTCKGAGPNNCTSCFELDSLDTNFNSCNHTNPYAQDFAEFTGGGVIPDYVITDSSWFIWTYTAYKTAVDSTCFFPFYTVGGYYIMDRNNFLYKTISYLMPHYRISVRFHVFISGTVNAPITIYFDNYLKYTSLNFNSSNPLLYLTNRTCLGIGDPMFHGQIYYGQDHQSSSVKISIYLSGSGTYFWGINNYVIKLEECHPTCKNCSGPASTQCLSCYGFATLTSTNSCVCNTGYALAPSISVVPCSSYPCSACIPQITNCLAYNVSSCIQCVSPYLLSSSGNACGVCSTSCNTCSVTTTNCTSCNSGLYLEGNFCHNPCSFGLYGNDTDNTCKVCDSSCLTCSKTARNCTSCPTSRYFYLNSCMISCPNGTYNNVTDYTCRVCDVSCLTCHITSSNCTSCPISTYLQNNLCVSQCSSGYFLSYADSTCKKCDNSCLTCSQASTNCISCNNNTYLSNNLCVSQCPNGEYADATDNTCKNCNSLCSTCSNTSTNCTSCPANTFLYLNTCLNTCPNDTYTNFTDNVCYQCDISCITCNITATHCIDFFCPSNEYLQNNICVSQCSTGYYLSPTDNACKVCDNSCFTCSQASTNCSSCNNNSFLNVNSCVAQCPNGKYSNSSDNSCKSCDPSCQTCEIYSTNCTSCLPSQYLDKNICLELLKTTASLYKNYSQPNFYFIIFSNFSDVLLLKIQNNQTQSFNLSISNLSASDYSYNLSKSLTQNGTFVFSFNFIKTVNEFNILTINLNVSFLQDSISTFVTNNVSINLTSNIIYITPNLQTTTDPTTLILSFSDQFPYLFSKLNSISSVVISDFNRNNYNFSFQNTSNPLAFNFLINYKVSLLGFHTLNLIFSTKTQDFDSQQQILTKNTLTVQPINYYLLSESEKQAVETTKKTSTISSQTVNSATSVASIANSGSSLAYSALLLMKFIKFLKFLNINYPPNALAVFEAELNFFDVLPSFQINHNDNPVDLKFDYYNVDNYVMNSRGLLLCQSGLICCGAFFFNYFFNRFNLAKIIRLKFFSIIFNKMYEILCWNFLFTFLISSINDFFFYSVINLAFATTGDFWGILDVVISILLILSNLGFLILLYSKIAKINYIILCSRMNASVLAKRRNSPIAKIGASIFFQNSIIVPRKISEFPENSNNDINFKNNTFVMENATPPLETVRLNRIKPLAVKKSQIVSFEDKFVSSSEIILNDVSSTRLKTRRTNANLSQILNDSSEINSPSSINLNSPPPEKDYNRLISISAFRKKVNSVKLNSKMEIEPRKSEAKLISKENCEEEAYLRKYKILFEDFKQESKLTSIYFVLDLIKFPVISLIIILDRYQPLRASCLISGVTLGMLLFLIIIRPLKSKYLFIQYILNQVCVLFCTISALVLAYYDSENDNDQQKRLMVGWVIVYGNLGLIYFITAIMIGYSVLIALQMVKMFYHYLKTRKNRNTVFPFEKTQKEQQNNVVEPS